MARPPCTSCRRPLGSNGDCRRCREAAAGELATRARDVTGEEDVRRAAEAGMRFVRKPPWYARWGAAPRVLGQVDLASRVLQDWVSGRYRRVPWVALAALAAAVAYVLSPFDLVPDFLIPIGWSDDLLVLAAAWAFAKADLRRYCEWKGLEPSEFGL